MRRGIPRVPLFSLSLSRSISLSLFLARALSLSLASGAQMGRSVDGPKKSVSCRWARRPRHSKRALKEGASPCPGRVRALLCERVLFVGLARPVVSGWEDDTPRSWSTWWRCVRAPSPDRWTRRTCRTPPAPSCAATPVVAAEVVPTIIMSRPPTAESTWAKLVVGTRRRGKGGWRHGKVGQKNRLCRPSVAILLMEASASFVHTPPTIRRAPRRSRCSKRRQSSSSTAVFVNRCAST